MGWLPPSPDGIAMCQNSGVLQPLSGKDGNRDERYDDWRGSGKACFSGSRGFDGGADAISEELTRNRFQQFMAEQEPCVVVIEACVSALYWAREMSRLGHDVKLVAPRYVRPFVKRHKNDAADAEAIVEAGQRPGMRFVEAKPRRNRQGRSSSGPGSSWCASGLI